MVYERSEKPISLRESLAEGIRNGDVNRVRELIEAGADVNAKKPSGFPIMEYATDECMLRLLIDNGADLNSRWRDGSTWLHSASLGDFHEAEMLLRHGADPNARDDDDETPLFAAEHARRADIAELLVSHGANVDAQNNDGWTALHGAVVGGSYEVAKVLLRFGANVELCDKEGDTPLIMAANMYHVWKHDFVGLLLEHGADVNGSGRDGFRALHCAAVHGSDSLVRRLVEAGGDVNAEAVDGLTPLDLALLRGHASTAQVLRELGGREGQAEGSELVFRFLLNRTKNAL